MGQDLALDQSPPLTGRALSQQHITVISVYKVSVLINPLQLLNDYLPDHYLVVDLIPLAQDQQLLLL